MSGTTCTLQDGQTKQLINLEVSNKISYNVIIVSRTNISQKKLNKHLEKTLLLKPNVEVFIFCDKGTPNTYGATPQAIVDKLSINETAFTRLHKKLS